MNKKFDRSVSLLSWAYNEEDSILGFLEQASALLDNCVEDWEIVLVDDGSTDRTAELAAAFQKKEPRLKIYRNERNLNVGISCRRAIQYASKEYLFWEMIDWCYDISNLREYLEYLKEYDIVQGVRRRPVSVKLGVLKPLAGLARLFGLKHLTRRSDTLQKAVISVINYIVVRTLFNVPLSDYQNVTFYPTKWIQGVHYVSSSSFINPEMLIRSYWAGKSFKEVDISFIPREQGTAKGTRPRAILKSLEDIFSFWLREVLFSGRLFSSGGNGRVSRLGTAGGA